MYARFILPAIAFILGTASALPYPSGQPPYPMVTRTPEESKACEDLPTLTTVKIYGTPPPGVPPPITVLTKWCASGQPTATGAPLPTPPPSGYEGEPPQYRKRAAEKESTKPETESKEHVDFSSELLPLASALQQMERNGGKAPVKRSDTMKVFVHDLPDLEPVRLPKRRRTLFVDDSGSPLHSAYGEDPILKRTPIMSEEYVDPGFDARLQKNSAKWRSGKDDLAGGGTMSIMPIKREALAPLDVLEARFRAEREAGDF
ncbi:Hypothetical protein D9617_1g079660 [Elsinoe fawcettii]|nr:Hypothetical protein D9617_1g079660 [Elsinoe fawcettii]